MINLILHLFIVKLAEIKNEETISSFSYHSYLSIYAIASIDETGKQSLHNRRHEAPYTHATAELRLYFTSIILIYPVIYYFQKRKQR